MAFIGSSICPNNFTITAENTQIHKNNYTNTNTQNEYTNTEYSKWLFISSSICPAISIKKRSQHLNRQPKHCWRLCITKLLTFDIQPEKKKKKKHKYCTRHFQMSTNTIPKANRLCKNAHHGKKVFFLYFPVIVFFCKGKFLVQRVLRGKILIDSLRQPH